MYAITVAITTCSGTGAKLARLWGGLYLEIAEKLWSEHPSLRPREVGGHYEFDAAIFEPRFYAVRRDTD
jgi:hypothetical protein